MQAPKCKNNLNLLSRLIFSLRCGFPGEICRIAVAKSHLVLISILLQNIDSCISKLTLAVYDTYDKLLKIWTTYFVTCDNRLAYDWINKDTPFISVVLKPCFWNGDLGIL